MYIKRKIEYQINKYLNTKEIIALVGPRQCGKTTFFQNLFKTLDRAVFITFEDQKILNLFEKNLDLFIQEYVIGNKYIFIDEFQYADNGGKNLKFIFDTQNIEIFITGSSAIDLTVRAFKFLVGRIFVFNLYPFDFEEYLSFKDINLSEQLSIYKKSKELPSSDFLPGYEKYYEEYIVYGGYPRVVLAESEEEKKEILKNIYNTYFLREVRDILGLVDDYKLSLLIKALASQIGNMVNYQELEKLSEFSYPTLKKNINFLEKTYIAYFVRPFFTNKRIEIVKNPKIYFFDSGLRNSVLNDFRQLSQRNDAGALVENAFSIELTKKGLLQNYWRTKRKEEIDFIVQFPDNKKIAYEIKKTEKNNFKPNLFFSKKYPNINITCLYLQSKENPPGNSLPIFYF